jgi:hypothetical protein
MAARLVRTVWGGRPRPQPDPLVWPCPNTVHFELWGRLQSAEGFSPTSANHEKPAAGGLKAAAA